MTIIRITHWARVARGYVLEHSPFAIWPRSPDSLTLSRAEHAAGGQQSAGGLFGVLVTPHHDT